jgi:hypothetical protein
MPKIEKLKSDFRRKSSSENEKILTEDEIM